ncbi:hypothetical protein P4B35_08550 [Pontiellaceae bacterium B12227]|nr:hypothetical protein [Pontiellaceae bacterium B12227]
MKKTVMVVAMMAGLALSASAGLLEYWEFNEAAGVDLNDAPLVNSGSLGSLWNFGGAGMATDGAGSLVLAGDGGTTTRKVPKKGTVNANTATDDYATPLAGSDTYTIEMNLSAFDLTAASIGDAVNFKALDSAGVLVALINVEKDSATTSRIRFAAANSNYRNYAYTLSEGAHTAKVEFNLSLGTAEYFIDGESKTSFADQTYAGNIGGLVLVKAGSWTTAASSIGIDSMGLSVIPEPATLGLIVSFGGGILLIRRRFML